MPSNVFANRSFFTTAALIVGVTTGIAHSAEDPAKGGVIAVVSCSAILQSELDDRLRPQLTDLNSRIYRLRQRALDELIDRRLLELDAIQHGVSLQAYLV